MGVWLLTTQKPIKRQVGGKESLLYFGGWQPGWAGHTDSCPKMDSLHPDTDNQGARAFIDGGRGLRAETAQSALTVVLKLVMQWSDQCHLDCFKYS